MFLIHINAWSKNKGSLKNFKKILKKLLKKKLQLNIASISYLKKKQRCNKISVLTSPNANKNAQEQFFYQIYKYKIILYIFNNQKFLVLLKKIKQYLFTDIKIRLFFDFSKSNFIRTAKKAFNPEHYKTAFFKTKLLKKIHSNQHN